MQGRSLSRIAQGVAAGDGVEIFAQFDAHHHAQGVAARVRSEQGIAPLGNLGAGEGHTCSSITEIVGQVIVA